MILNSQKPQESITTKQNESSPTIKNELNGKTNAIINSIDAYQIKSTYFPNKE